MNIASPIPGSGGQAAAIGFGLLLTPIGSGDETAASCIVVVALVTSINQAMVVVVAPSYINHSGYGSSGGPSYMNQSGYGSGGGPSYINQSGYGSGGGP